MNAEKNVAKRKELLTQIEALALKKAKLDKEIEREIAKLRQALELVNQDILKR